MFVDYICSRADKAARSCDTRDPFRIARQLGIHVETRQDFKRLKGMYAVIKRNRFIFLNGNLPERALRTVCAHELGHDALHRELAKDAALQEFMLYDMKSRPEYEANLFAAHLLLDEKEILEQMREKDDIFHVAGEMDADMNLLLIKLDAINRKGHRFNIPYMPHADFLGED